MNAFKRKIQAVARAYKPRRYRHIQRPTKYGVDGWVTWDGKIYSPPLDSAYALFVFLHECGHVAMGDHLHEGRNLPTDPPYWLIEYEAEIWAITAMRARGFKITKEMLNNARENVAYQFERWGHDCDSDDPECLKALKFAFPKEWRKWL